ncbi:hypothetical protein HDV05_005070, partial [Chytridiales sp. JEL 0842]
MDMAGRGGRGATRSTAIGFCTIRHLLDRQRLGPGDPPLRFSGASGEPFNSSVGMMTEAMDSSEVSSTSSEDLSPADLGRPQPPSTHQQLLQGHLHGSVPFKWSVLDSWAVEYLYIQGCWPSHVNLSDLHLLDVDDLNLSWTPEAKPSGISAKDSLNTSVSLPPSPRSALDSLKMIESSILSGDIESAITRLKSLVPSLFNDPAICFRLEKQRMIESVRSINSNDSNFILSKIQQTNLASSALTAYPEAFADLKKTLVGLLWKRNMSTKSYVTETDEDGHAAKRQMKCKVPSGVDSEWSSARRKDLATAIHSAAVKELGIPEPRLSLFLRYLTMVHNMYFFFRSDPSTIAKYTERLLIPDTVTIKTSNENEDSDITYVTFDEATRCTDNPYSHRVDEREIFILAQAAAVSPDQARASLIRYTNNTSSTIQGQSLSRMQLAMKHEVSKLGVDHQFLAETTIAYCKFRGILPSETKASKVRALIAKHKAQHSFSTLKLLDELETLVPGFCSAQVLLVFALWRVDCLEILARGRSEEALGVRDSEMWREAVRILQKELGPLSETHPSLITCIKELSVLTAMRYRLSKTDSFVLEDHLQLFQDLRNGVLDVALCAAAAMDLQKIKQGAGDELPLIQILDSLLDVHKNWFRQQCEED